ncbi:zinc-dependent alcohol dehydrogenase [Phytoactinopolyspora halotolerans]|uniref:Zinc-binding alcohol dehydrogenase n=1 Tax=Phytoactinopolyspora halotolerans TaxID=1981512 RepID=A0A6L9SFM3_9ACTN|nr:zinc-binding alcohol dehydrogenase [Phytoactinopolyspora halotolerans]NEE03917.1 zinc-binding alcohol dehydrogenase [Phytoactinopolyspora halotolerans]
MAQMVIFPRPREARLEDVELDSMTAETIRIRTTVSLVSTGTETIQFAARFKDDSKWADFVTYPYRPGYSCVGVVEEIGADVRNVAVGDRVVIRGRHASHHVTAEQGGYGYTPLPPGLEGDHAAWFAMAKIAFVGALAAEVSLGKRALVIGAGPIGQMATRWAAAAGCASVVTVDPLAERLPLAEAGGATGTVCDIVSEGADAIVEAFNGHRPEIVIDSTGNPAVLAEALKVVDDHGRVVILGTATSDTAQQVTSDIHWRGVTVTGAHDSHTLAVPRWDRDQEIFRLFFHLAASGRFPLDGLTTHRFSPVECQEAFELLEDQRGKTLGVIFDWTDVDP